MLISPKGVWIIEMNTKKQSKLELYGLKNPIKENKPIWRSIKAPLYSSNIGIRYKYIKNIFSQTSKGIQLRLCDYMGCNHNNLFIYNKEAI